MQQKKCAKCKQEKDIIEFRNIKGTDRYFSYCKECQKAYMKDYYKKHKFSTKIKRKSQMLCDI